MNHSMMLAIKPVEVAHYELKRRNKYCAEKFDNEIKSL